MQTRYVIMLTAAAAVIAGSSGNLLSAEGPVLKPVLASVQGTEAQAATTVSEPEGGPLGTMPHGRYQCALPGDAVSSAIDVVDAENFQIAQASSYTNPEGRGIYLMRGKTLTFTRGPKKGERFKRIGDNQLQRIAKDGSLSKLICTRLGGSA